MTQSQAEQTGWPGVTAHVNALCRLNRNEHPHGASSSALSAAQTSLQESHRYPDPESVALRSALGTHLGVAEANVAVGNGIDELILLIAMTTIADPRPAVITDTTFMSYSNSLRAIGKDYRRISLENYRIPVDTMSECFADGASVAFICNPHNPAGSILEVGGVRHLCETAQRYGVLLVMDEAYAEYAEYMDAGYESALQYAKCMPQVCVLRTFSKAYGLAGLRAGYAVGSEAIIGKVNCKRSALPFDLNRVAQSAAIYALQDQGYLQDTCSENLRGLTLLQEGLDNLGVPHVSSHASFVLLKLGGGSEKPARRLAERGILVADAATMGMPGHIRVSVGSSSEIEQLLYTLKEVIADE